MPISLSQAYNNCQRVKFEFLLKMAQIVNGADKMLLKISFDFIFPFNFQTIMIEIAIQNCFIFEFNY